MLNPRFFTTPDNQVLPNGVAFTVLFYSQIEAFTLVRWRWSAHFEVPPDREPSEGFDQEGESLYRGEELLASSNCEYLSLGESSDEDDWIRHLSPDPRSRVNSNVGNYGLSPSMAADLRAPQNQVWFEV